jgi:phenylpropionate dioxygenase-like ring-hydroxylating dioxygenase large terminal subunit
MAGDPPFKQTLPMVSASHVPLYRARRQQKPVAEILQDIRETAARPLTLSQTLPPETYTSDAFFEWEAEHILRRDWLCLAHVSQLPAAGDFITVDILGEPLLVSHGKDGVIRTLSRVCPHRAMDIVPEHQGTGHTRIFICPYHAWTFELDGKLKGSPEMQQAECFDRAAIGLQGYRTEIWCGFVFVNLSGTAEPVSQLYAEMGEDLAAWHPEELEVVVELSWDCEFNWKVLVENFMECYHHIGTHSKTLQPMMPARECWTEEERATYVREHLPLKESLLDQLHEAIAAGKEFPLFENVEARRTSEWGLFVGYPSLLLFPGPNQLIWYRIDPLSPDQSRLLTTVLAPKAWRELPQFETCRESARQALIEFHTEDMTTCSAVQRGLYASGCQRGRLSHLEMPIWLFHRYLAARSQGKWPTQDLPAAVSQSGRIGPVPA